MHEISSNRLRPGTPPLLYLWAASNQSFCDGSSRGIVIWYTTEMRTSVNFNLKKMLNNNVEDARQNSFLLWILKLMLPNFTLSYY